MSLFVRTATTRLVARRTVAAAIAGFLMASWPAVALARAAEQNPAGPPPVRLSLEEALQRAEGRNRQIAVAEAGVLRAQGDETRARSQVFPQINASASYDRTLASEFSGIFSSGAGAPACAPFSPQPAAPLADRVSEIERALDCGAIANSFSFGAANLSELPFGQRNIWRVNLTFTQNLYTGGRIGAQRALAASGRQAAGLSLDSARAQLALDVTQAYYDAALSDQMVAIAEATLQQAEATLAQVELSRAAGRVPEFDQLRARVARDNQRPVLIRVRASRTLAYLRLKQLLEVPPEQEVVLAAGLDQADLPPPERFASALASFEASRGTAAVDRAAVRQAAVGVAAREASLRLARSQRLPSVNFNSLYGRVAYPSGMPSFGDFRTNWTVGVQAQLPLFTGGRQRGDEMVARADVDRARAELALTRQASVVDTRGVYEQLASARAVWDASAGTVEQAARAYQIAELRYREGISTQVELSDARLLLEQAQANRAQAARDLQVARAHAALLPDLPLGSGGSSPAVPADSGFSASPGAAAAGQSLVPAGQPAIGAPQTVSTGGGRPGGASTQ